MEDKRSADLESQTKLQSLVKEKDELLDLAMQRGKIIQVKHIMKIKHIRQCKVFKAPLFGGGGKLQV